MPWTFWLQSQALRRDCCARPTAVEEMIVNNGDFDEHCNRGEHDGDADDIGDHLSVQG